MKFRKNEALYANLILPILAVLLSLILVSCGNSSPSGTSADNGNDKGNDTSKNLVVSDVSNLVCATSASCIENYKAAASKSSVADALDEFVPANKYDFSFIPEGEIEDIVVSLSGFSNTEGVVPTFDYRVNIKVDDKDFALGLDSVDNLSFGDLTEKRYLNAFKGTYIAETEEKAQAKNMLGQTETVARQGIRISVTEGPIVTVAVSERLSPERAEVIRAIYAGWISEGFQPESGEPEGFIIQNLDSEDYEFFTGISGEGNKIEMGSLYRVPKGQPNSVVAEELANDFSLTGWETTQVQTDFTNSLSLTNLIYLNLKIKRNIQKHSSPSSMTNQLSTT